jgi:hypothetical protein
MIVPMCLVASIVGVVLREQDNNILMRVVRPNRSQQMIQQCGARRRHWAACSSRASLTIS